MKKIILFLGLIMIFFLSFSQKENKASLELRLIYNYVFSENGGFGAAINPIFFTNKRISMLLGLEYFPVSEKSGDTIYERYSRETNLTYKYNYISIPLGIRVNLGEKIKVFCESGIGLDVMIYGNKSGTMDSWGPIPGYEGTEPFEDNFMTLPNVGMFVGPGVILPGENASFLFKTDFRYSFTPSFKNGIDEHNFRCLMFSAGIKF